MTHAPKRGRRRYARLDGPSALAFAQAAAEEFGVSVDELANGETTWKVAKARGVAAYLFAELRDFSGYATAALFNFTPPSFLRAQRLVRERMSADDCFRAKVERLRARLAPHVARTQEGRAA